MQIEQVDFVSVPTRDFSRAAAWYRDVLGLPLSEYSEGEIETPNVTLSFWNPEEQGEQIVPNENGIALRVADLDGNVLILHRRYAPREKRGEA
jgi:catechol 2,3-dioxygenase-like lactoylglutathione lyase family enzyme